MEMSGVVAVCCLHKYVNPETHDDTGLQTFSSGSGMDFHEELSRLGEKEGLKGRKLNKAVESFTWNITVLKGQSDLLRGAKMDSLDALRQLALACEACGLTASSSSNSSSSSFSTAELHYSSHPTSGRRSSTHGNGRV